MAVSKIEIPDSTDAQVQGLRIYGRSEQNQYRGYNLYNANNGSLIKNGWNGTQSILSDNSLEVVAYNGWRHVSISLDQAYAGKKLYIKLKVKCISSVVPDDVEVTSRRIWIGTSHKCDYNSAYYNATPEIIDVGVEYSVSFYGTMDSTEPGLSFLCKASTEGKLIRNTYRIYDIIVSESDVEYEPYCGVRTSPNIDYPQEVNSSSNFNIDVYGPNLLDISKVIRYNYTPVQETPRIIKFTPSGSYPRATWCFTNLPSGYYTLYCGRAQIDNIPTDVEWGSFVTDASDGSVGSIYAYNSLISISSNPTSYRFYYDSSKGNLIIYLRPSGGVGSNNSNKVCVIEDYRMSFEHQSSKSLYFPYKGSTNINIPYELNSVPVTSGSNVTVNGKQYVSDYIDYNSKKLWKMTHKLIMDGVNSGAQSTWNKGPTGDYTFWMSGPSGYIMRRTTNYSEIWCNYLPPTAGTDGGFHACSDPSKYGVGSNGIYNQILMNLGGGLTQSETNAKLKELYDAGKPLYVIYALQTPYSIDLTDDDIQQYNQINTYYNNTTIVINSDVVPKVEIDYIADKKNYIDRVFEELKNKITA